jgi:hypothetical protein
MKFSSARVSVVACVAAGLISLSGCAAPAQRSADADQFALPKVSIDTYAGTVSHLDYEHGIADLPTNDLDLNAPGYVMRVLHAIAVRADTCMQKKGLPAIASELDWRPYVGDEERTLGRWSTAYASRYGVDPAPESRPAEIDVLSKGVEFNKAYGQCADTAKESLQSQLQFSQDRNVISAIKWRAYKLVTTSAEGKKAIGDWHSCAESAGVVLDSESGGPSPQYVAQGKQAEIKAFFSYADCAKTTGAVQKVFDLRARYEAALLAASEAQVAAFTEDRARVVKKLDEATAGR